VTFSAAREGTHGASLRDWPPISAVLVVVPAHDEVERIGRCVRSVRQSAEALLSPSSDVTLHRVRQVEVVVVLDRCTDGTAAGVADPSVHLVDLDAGCVGAARGAGILRGMAVSAASDPRSVLVVNTDADCIVPRDWLMDLVSLAAGHDLVLGEVHPDPSEMSPISLDAWWRRHPRGRGSLHGANLAVRLDAYLSVGGFAAVSEQEDVLLVRALRAAGARVVGGTRVMTSGRRDGRVPEGFAGYLRALDDELALQGEIRAQA
jgi:glycosyltransferase involved in cell wall biosynthesis